MNSKYTPFSNRICPKDSKETAKFLKDNPYMWLCCNLATWFWHQCTHSKAFCDVFLEPSEFPQYFRYSLWFQHYSPRKTVSHVFQDWASVARGTSRRSFPANSALNVCIIYIYMIFIHIILSKYVISIRYLFAMFFWIYDIYVIYLFTLRLSACLSVCLFVCLFVCLSIYLSIYLGIKMIYHQIFFCVHWSRFNYTHVIFQSWQIHICIHPSYVLNYFSHHVSLLLHHGATHAEMGVIEDFEQLMGRLRQSWAWP